MSTNGNVKGESLSSQRVNMLFTAVSSASTRRESQTQYRASDLVDPQSGGIPIQMAVDYQNHMNDILWHRAPSEACSIPFLVRVSDIYSGVRASARAMDTQDPEEFRELYQLGSLFSKYPFEIPGVDRAGAALKKLIESEDKCYETNLRVVKNDTRIGYTWEREMLSRVRDRIHRILGDFSYQEVFAHVGFGPGATTSLPRRKGDAYYKFGNPSPNLTENLKPYVGLIEEWSPLWGKFLRDHSKANIIEGNRVTTVPKSSKIDRCIAIEPDLNQCLQKGLGGVIRDRLRRAGCDLNSQTWNQDLAFVGSLTREYATIDLSSASDTVAYELVKYLLPSSWFHYVDVTRSPMGFLPDGDIMFWQKVSSMGNGYTFELESLIFWALVETVRSNCGGEGTRRAVYGDDIIVAEPLVEPLVRMLEFMGFSVNEGKSFWGSHPFRESCGVHFWDGLDVTPIYVRKHLNSLPTLVSLHNACILRGMKNHYMEYRCPWWDGVAEMLRQWAPRRTRDCFVPWNDGETTGFWASFDTAHPEPIGSVVNNERIWNSDGTFTRRRVVKGQGWEGWRVRRIAVKQPAIEAEGEQAVLRALWHGESQAIDSDAVAFSSEQEVKRRLASYGYTLKKGTVSKWCDLPPVFAF